MKSFTLLSINSSTTFLQSLKRLNLVGLFAGNEANAQIQGTMGVKRTYNSFGNEAMKYRTGLATTRIITFQATSTNNAASFLFADNHSFSPKWTNSASVNSKNALPLLVKLCRETVDNFVLVL